jgi:hypothetical protein
MVLTGGQALLYKSGGGMYNMARRPKKKPATAESRETLRAVRGITDEAWERAKAASEVAGLAMGAWLCLCIENDEAAMKQAKEGKGRAKRKPGKIAKSAHWKEEGVYVAEAGIMLQGGGQVSTYEYKGPDGGEVAEVTHGEVDGETVTHVVDAYEEVGDVVADGGADVGVLVVPGEDDEWGEEPVEGMPADEATAVEDAPAPVNIQPKRKPDFKKKIAMNRTIAEKATVKRAALAAVKRVIGEPIRKKNAKATCAHGETRGNHCWQCGGLAAVNA